MSTHVPHYPIVLTVIEETQYGPNTIAESIDFVGYIPKRKDWVKINDCLYQVKAVTYTFDEDLTRVEVVELRVMR